MHYFFVLYIVFAMGLCIGCGKEFKQLSRHAPYCQKTDQRINNISRGVAEGKAAARVRDKLKQREEKRRARAMQEEEDRAEEARAEVRRMSLPPRSLSKDIDFTG